jgi:hypothetical protein
MFSYFAKVKAVFILWGRFSLAMTACEGFHH